MDTSEKEKVEDGERKRWLVYMPDELIKTSSENTELSMSETKHIGGYIETKARRLDVVTIHAGDRMFRTTRKTLCCVPGTFLEAVFSGRWAAGIDDEDKDVFLDVDPDDFEILLNAMRRHQFTGGLGRMPLPCPSIYYLWNYYSFPTPHFFDSDIISTNEEIDALVSFLLDRHPTRPTEKISSDYIITERLYSDRIGSASASDFHAKCDKQGATLTIIECELGIKFGGYNPRSWMSSNVSDPAIGTEFLFTLYEFHNSTSLFNKDERKHYLEFNPKIFPAQPGEVAISDFENLGPTFGRDGALGTFGREVRYSWTNENDPGFAKGRNGQPRVLTINAYYTIASKVEVWRVVWI